MNITLCIAGNKVPYFLGLNKTLQCKVNHSIIINFHNHVIDDNDADDLKIVIETNIPQNQFSFGKLHLCGKESSSTTRISRHLNHAELTYPV